MKASHGLKKTKVPTTQPGHREKLSWKVQEELSYDDLCAYLGIMDLHRNPLSTSALKTAQLFRTSPSTSYLPSSRTDCGHGLPGDVVNAPPPKTKTITDCVAERERYCYLGASMELGSVSRDLPLSGIMLCVSFDRLATFGLWLMDSFPRSPNIPAAFASLTWRDGWPVANFNRRSRVEAFQWKRQAEDMRRRAGFRVAEPSRKAFDGLVEEIGYEWLAQADTHSSGRLTANTSTTPYQTTQAARTAHP